MLELEDLELFSRGSLPRDDLVTEVCVSERWSEIVSLLTVLAT